MSYKLKNKCDGKDNTPLFKFESGPCNGLVTFCDDDFDNSGEVYFKVATTWFTGEESFKFCRINLKDLSIMGCEDETLKLTEEQYKQIIDSLYDNAIGFDDYTCWEYIMYIANDYTDNEEDYFINIQMPEKETYNYSFAKEENI